MKKNKKPVKMAIYARVSLLFTSVLILAGCEKSSDEITYSENHQKPPSAVVSQSASITDLARVLKANKAKQPSLVTASQTTSRVNGAATYIHFGDKTACQWTPSICSSSFVVWPGYIQSTSYNEWGYAWMSNGPGTNFLSHTAGAHYHILGLFSPKDEPNPTANAMFGTDWFAFYMQRGGKGRINFDLTQILVGKVPITLWFKAADGSWWYWASLSQGRWNLPGATNIQEIHIRAASASPNDKHSIDDILVKGL